MEKAYDLKVLQERLKEEGLTIAEDGAEKVYKVVSQWVKESAPLSKTPVDDMALVIFPNLDKIVLPQIDKIDGKEG